MSSEFPGARLFMGKAQVIPGVGKTKGSRATRQNSAANPERFRHGDAIAHHQLVAIFLLNDPPAQENPETVVNPCATPLNRVRRWFPSCVLRSLAPKLPNLASASPEGTAEVILDTCQPDGPGEKANECGQHRFDPARNRP